MFLACIRLPLFVWLAPILLGSVCAAYEFILYSKFALNPSTAPDYLTMPVPAVIVLGAALAACVFGGAVRKTMTGKTSWALVTIASLLCFTYVFWRAAAVNAEFSIQLGYACCSEGRPSWGQTLLSILDPLFHLW